MRGGVTALLSTMAAIPLLAGCATTSSPPPTSGTSTSTNPATDAPAFAEDTARQSGEGSGEADLVLIDVRVADGEGFDRIVLEFSGTGTPGWVVNYVDEATLDGSGNAVALGGSAILDIYASGTTWPAPDYYRGPSHVAPENGGDINDVYVGGTFEGDHTGTHRHRRRPRPLPGLRAHRTLTPRGRRDRRKRRLTPLRR